ncbi:MAG TPA: TIGR02757 family protein [Terriglobia bacterium]|nr:TIGR02757 family protein [Terriglobia bacterium]
MDIVKETGDIEQLGRNSSSLKFHLDAFIDGFPKKLYILNDPVQHVRRYDDPRDREVAGLITSALSYGNVKIILDSVDRALSLLGPHPAEAIAAFDPQTDMKRLRRFYHRFNTGRDLAVFFWMIRRALEDFGSIENAFLAGLAESTDAPLDTGAAMDQFSNLMLGFGHERFYPKGELARRIAVRFFLPTPVDGSACKRMNLYLRWMVRPDDGVDCGVWKRLSPRSLVIPLDTHIARISSYIGLTARKSPGWAMALDITRSLRLLDAEDPLQYDFALCHLGIAGDCPRKRNPQKCAKCPILPVCRL